MRVTNSSVNSEFLEFAMRIVFLAIAIFLSGCAAQVVSSNPRSVTVESLTADVADAQKAADKECAKHSAYARMSGRASDRHFVYDCIR